MRKIGHKKTARVLLGAVLAAACLAAHSPCAADSPAGEPIGTVEAVLYAKNPPDATVAETTLGRAAADAVRVQCGADAAILCGGAFRANLQGGPVTAADIEAVFGTDCPLGIARVSPAELRSMLEAGVSHSCLAEDETLDMEASAFDGFPQIAGFTFTYDVTDPVGKRVQRICLDDGRELDLAGTEPVLTLAATQFMLSGGYDMPSPALWEPTELTLSDAVIQYLTDGHPLCRPALGAVTVKGPVVRFMDRVPTTLLWVVAAFLAVGSASGIWKVGKHDRFDQK